MKYYLVTVNVLILSQLALLFSVTASTNNEKKSIVNFNKIENEVNGKESATDSQILFQNQDAFQAREANAVAVAKEDVPANDARSPVTWFSPCTASQGGAGNGTLWGFQFEGCLSTGNCTVMMDKHYPLILDFRPGRIETALTMNLTTTGPSPANTVTLRLARVNITNPPFNTSSVYTLQHGVVFPSEFIKTAGTYNLQVRLFSPDDSQNVICLSFPVIVKKTLGNEGTVANATCTVQNLPCAFDNSICVRNGSLSQYFCECASGFFYEGSTRGCKKILGTTCQQSIECIRNAECTMGTSTGQCNCTMGYESSASDPTTCSPKDPGNTGTSVGDSCSNLYEPCTFENSMCLSNSSNEALKTCQCASSFYYEGALKGCKKTVGTYCTLSTECIQNAYCLLQVGLNFGFCDCSPGYKHDVNSLDICYRSNGGNTGTSPGTSCSVLDEPCAFADSMCMRNSTGLSNTCQCDSSYFYEGSARGCKKIIGTYCEQSNQCIENAYCPLESGLSFGFCNCTSGYQNDAAALDICYTKNPANTGTSPGASCSNLYEPCAFANSMCLSSSTGLSSNCQCDQSFYYEGSARGCKKTIGTYCEESSECIENAYCPFESGLNFGFCNCSTGYENGATDLNVCKRTGAGNSGSYYGASCSNLNETCAFANSLCVSGYCQCDLTSFYETNIRACKRVVGATCSSSKDCISNADCEFSGGSTSGQCQCRSGNNGGSLSVCSDPNTSSSIVASILTLSCLVLISMASLIA